MLELRVVDLQSVIDDVVGIARRTFPESIDICIERSEAGGSVQADTGQLEQVILNLALNARDAMPEGGVLTISLAPVDLDAQSASHDPRVNAGPHMRIRVSDTGTGIESASRDRIFEPFYTTKEPGKGTGLGLAMVQGIVHQHGGFIRVDSAAGSGTSFEVYLPVVDAPVVAPPAIPRGLDCPRGRGEVVVVVEDDPAVRDATCQMLESLGYRTLPVRDAEVCMQVSWIVRHVVDVLLTDVVMPTTTGRRVAEQMRRHQPNVRVLYMSGYAAEVISHHGVLDDGAHLLHKPFTLRELADKLRQVLA